MMVWFFFEKREKGKSRCFAKQQLIGMSIFLMTMFLMSCESNQNTGNKELVKTYFDAAFAKNYELLDTLLHQDFIFIGPKLSDTLDKPELINSWKSTHQRNDIMKMHHPKIYDVSQQAILGKNQSLILHYYDAEFHNADLDVWVEFPVHVKFLIAEDKIQQAQIIINQSDIQKQLGYTIIPPNK